MHTIVRDEGRLVPMVKPRHWQASTIRRSRERSALIAQSRDARKRWRLTTAWLHDLDRRGIAALEANGIEWSPIQTWLDELEPHEAGAARRFVTQVLRTLADDTAAPRERFEAERELRRRLVAAGAIE